MVKDKKLKKLKDHHDYLNRKVAELTEDRKKDRSDETKLILKLYVNSRTRMANQTQIIISNIILKLSPNKRFEYLTIILNKYKCESPIYAE